MKNFKFQNPTKIIFGEDQFSSLVSEIPANSKVLITYGGGSIKKNGIYDQVTKALSSFEVVEFGGIPSNPEYAVLLEAIELIKKEEITFILAVGGGSVIDGTKFLAAAAHSTEANPWSLLTDGKPILTGMPFGTVLTMPATGSEMNWGSVITRKETKEKLTMMGPGLSPQFSILDPRVVASIPKRHLANGLADAFSHVLEQYITYPADALLQDRFSESILKTLIEVAPTLLETPSDHKAAANYMWSCTMALNGLIEAGAPTDWAVHAIGHELTALYGIDHAKTLAVIAPSHYRYNLENKKEKLAQFAQRIWNVTEGNVEEKALAGIDKLEEFFHNLGIETSLSKYTDEYEGTAEIIAKRFTDRGWIGLGELQSVTPDDVEKIVKMSY